MYIFGLRRSSETGGKLNLKFIWLYYIIEFIW